jgi:hypothetical protein
VRAAEFKVRNLSLCGVGVGDGVGVGRFWFSVLVCWNSTLRIYDRKRFLCEK